MKKLEYRIKQFFTYTLGLAIAMPFGLGCLILEIIIKSWATIGFGVVIMIISIVFTPLCFIKYKKLLIKKFLNKENENI